MEKRVLILTSVASMIEQFTIPSIKLLIDMNFKVHVACNFVEGNTSTQENILRLKSVLDGLGVEYHQIDFKRSITKVFSNSKAYKQVVNLMKCYKFQFVHCHSPIGGFCGRLAANKTGTKCIYTAHGFHFYKGAPLLNWLIYYPIEKWLSRYTDCLITINSEDYDLAVNKKFKAKSIKLVHGVGIDLDKFKPATKDEKYKLRLEHGFSSDDFVLIYVGELSYRKHQDMLIRVAKILKNDIPNLKVLLVGTGGYDERYKKLANELKLEEIIFMGYRNDIKKLMCLSDIVVSTSRQEGLPVNIMEAMACGLPLVVTDCRGNRDLVSGNGYVIPVDDVDKFSSSIKELFSKNELGIDYAHSSSFHINEYNLINILLKMKNIYELF